MAQAEKRPKSGQIPENQHLAKPLIHLTLTKIPFSRFYIAEKLANIGELNSLEESTRRCTNRDTASLVY